MVSACFLVATTLGGFPRGGLSVDHEQCAACEFDASEYGWAQLLEAIRNLGPQWKRLLLDAGGELRKRPAPATWSALEYAAHSRDITALHVFGVEQALTMDEPKFPEIAGDELVENAAASYASEDPVIVGMELEDEALKLADLAQASGPASWTRGVTFGSWRSDVRLLLEHALHDSHHHLVDVKKGLVVLRARSH
jgi:S-DNA-T family DNA segregation ATPase FtsK/SpoIIIE